MIVISHKDVFGKFVTPMPFQIESKDIDALINGKTFKNDPESVKKAITEHIDKRLGHFQFTDGILPMAVNDSNNIELLNDVNHLVNAINKCVSYMRDSYFNQRYNGAFGAIYDIGLNKLEVCTVTQIHDYLDGTNELATSSDKQVEHNSGTITDFKALTSTRKLLKAIGGKLYYDGPNFKFESNHHQSPADSYIITLAKQYLMKVIIPNVLLAKKFGWFTEGPLAMKALDHCMTTGKSQKAKGAWKDIASDNNVMGPIYNLYDLYAANIKRDGTEVEKDRQWYFDKFVNLKCKDNKTRFRKGKTQDAVAELLARMDSESELKTASHRELMKMGISNLTARQFMKARRIKKGDSHEKNDDGTHNQE